MRKLLLAAALLLLLSTGIACLDVAPYPVVEVDAGAEEADTGAENADAGPVDE